MRLAHYAVIRYVADPARNEPVNVGIVLWNDAGSRLRLDDEAVARVVRDNPHLSRDSLLYLNRFLSRRLAVNRPLNGTGPLEDRIQEGSQFPVFFTEARFTTVRDGSEDALDTELEGLLGRIVRPQRRGWSGRPGTAANLAKRWKPWLGKRLVRNHVFEDSRTGIPRVVSFYANSGADVAVDVLGLAVKEANEIQQRADAEAYKVEDILAVHDLRYLVHCDLYWEDRYASANAAAIRTLETAGARVLTSLEDTATQVEKAIGVG